MCVYSQYNDYTCHKCDYLLTKGGYVVVMGITPKGQSAKFYLSPTPGNFKYHTEPQVALDQGDLINICCPSCRESLTSDQYPVFSTIQLVVNENIKFDILFSRKVGLNKTYIVTEDFTEEFGDSNSAAEKNLLATAS